MELSPNLIRLFDKQLTLRIDTTKLRAFIKVGKFRWPAITAKEIVTYLQNEHKIVYGLDHKTISLAIQKRDQEFQIAEGVAPIQGTDGSCEILFQVPGQNHRPKLLEDGSVDYRQLDSVVCVSAQTPLVRLIPEKEGSPGRTVFGDPIHPARVKPPQIKPGRNTRLNPADKTIYATINGLPVLHADNQVSVSDSVVIDQDIDYSVGNLQVPCNLVINGSVREGFSVKADGSITIRGNVENAFVDCGGDLTVTEGINNKNTGEVSVRGKLRCTYLNYAKITVDGDMDVAREILFSQIFCKGGIQVTREDGIIIGGEIVCFGTITANEVGSKLEATDTRITICPVEELLSRLSALENEKQRLEAELGHISQEMSGVAEYLESPTITTEEFTEFEKIYDVFFQKRTSIEEQHHKVKETVASIFSELQSYKPGELQVKQAIYPRVKIRIKGISTMTRYEEHRIAFLYSNNALRTRLL